MAARGDLICCIFILLAFIIHILSNRKSWLFLLSVFCFILALLSKEVAIVFPMAIVVYDFIASRNAVRRSLIRYSIYALLVLGYLYLRKGALERILAGIPLPEIISAYAGQLTNNIASSSIVQPPGGDPIVGLLENLFWNIKFALISYLFYLKKLVLPIDLSPFIVDYPRGIFFKVSSYIVITVLLLTSIFSIRRKEGLTAFGIIWILIFLMPAVAVSVLGKSATLYSERWLYIPSAGMCLLLGYWILEVGRKFNAEKIAWLFSIVIFITYSIITIDGQSIWKNNISLWAIASQRAPNTIAPYINYGHALRLEGKLDEAIQIYLKAFSPNVIASRTKLAYIANNLGVVYIEKGDYDKAEEWLNKSRSLLGTTSIRYIHHMGYISFLKGERDLKKNKYSVEHYKEAERYFNILFDNNLAREDEIVYILLAHVYIRLGETEKAEELAQTVLERNFDPELKSEAEAILKDINK